MSAKATPEEEQAFARYVAEKRQKRAGRPLPDRFLRNWQQRVLDKHVPLNRLGAEHYLAVYGQGLSEPKVILLALQAEAAQAPEMALAFWKYAYMLTRARASALAPAMLSPAVEASPSTETPRGMASSADGAYGLKVRRDQTLPRGVIWVTDETQLLALGRNLTVRAVPDGVNLNLFNVTQAEVEAILRELAGIADSGQMSVSFFRLVPDAYGQSSKLAARYHVTPGQVERAEADEDRWTPLA